MESVRKNPWSAPYFIKMARKKGVKFSFGTNNSGKEVGDQQYCLDMITECGLTPGDMFMPKAEGKKPVHLKQ